jgi:hypothetical protein
MFLYLNNLVLVFVFIDYADNPSKLLSFLQATYYFVYLISLRIDTP